MSNFVVLCRCGKSHMLEFIIKACKCGELPPGAIPTKDPDAKFWQVGNKEAFPCGLVAERLKDGFQFAFNGDSSFPMRAFAEGENLFIDMRGGV